MEGTREKRGSIPGRVAPMNRNRRFTQQRVQLPEQIHFPPSEGSNLERRCQEYEEAIQALGGIEVQPRL